MSDSVIMHQLTGMTGQRPRYTRDPDKLPINIVFGDYGGVNDVTCLAAVVGNSSFPHLPKLRSEGGSLTAALVDDFEAIEQIPFSNDFPVEAAEPAIA